MYGARVVSSDRVPCAAAYEILSDDEVRLWLEMLVHHEEAEIQDTGLTVCEVEDESFFGFYNAAQRRKRRKRRKRRDFYPILRLFRDAFFFLRVFQFKEKKNLPRERERERT